MRTASRHLSDAPEKATIVSISDSPLVDAKELQVNLSRATEASLAQATAEKRAEIWLLENREALESSNAYVERNGLPLSKYRQF